LPSLDFIVRVNPDKTPPQTIRGIQAWQLLVLDNIFDWQNVYKYFRKYSKTWML